MAERLPAHVFVMAKAPVAGAVKSRLAADIGPVEAVRFQRVTLARLARRLAPGPWRTRLAIAPDSALSANIWPAGIARVPQGRGDLGQRMQRQFDALPPGPAVIVGSDIPGIARRHIAAAFRMLGDHDAVFGPADDGGYWLVGLRRRPRVPRLFDGVDWSGRRVLDATLANCRGLSVGFLDTLGDVDTVEDWRRWRRRRG